MPKTTKIAGIIVLCLMLAPVIASAQGPGASPTGQRKAGSPDMPSGQKAGSGKAQQASSPTMEKRNTGEEKTGGKNQGRPGGIKGPGAEATSETPAADRSSGQAKRKRGGNASDVAVQRRSRVANAVREIQNVAERHRGIGGQISQIAKQQKEDQVKIEQKMKQVKSRSRIREFLFGPDHKALEAVKNKLESQETRIQKLKQAASEIEDKSDAQTLKDQVRVIEQVKSQLEKEVKEEQKGFSLFGWLTKMFA